MTQFAPVPSVVVPPPAKERPPISSKRQLGAYVLGSLPIKKPGGLLMYGQGRTGSNLLGDLLSSHPAIRFGNEQLGGRVRRPLAYVEGLRAHAAPHVYGIHVKRTHLIDVQHVKDPGAWLREAHAAGWQLVHLQRDDLLRHVLSNFSLNATAVSHVVKGDSYQTPQLRIDPADLLTWIEIRNTIRSQELDDLGDLPRCTVVYERDLLPGPDAWRRTAARVFAQLGVSPHEVSSPLCKVNQGSLADLLVNVDEVLAAIRGSRWAHLLEDDPDGLQPTGVSRPLAVGSGAHA
ncbi:MAG: nodH [Frankiales bacterium]|nr:nodH [Frankiales bacterium]